MIEDIRITGYSFLDAPFLPLEALRQYHLFYVFEGSGQLTVDSSSYFCQKDKLYFFPSLELACCRPDKENRLTIFRVSFQCGSFAFAKELSRLPNLIDTPADCRTLFLEFLHECSAKAPFYPDLCALQLERLLIPLLAGRNNPFRRGYLCGEVQPASDTPLSEVCAYIEHHLTEDLSIRMLTEVGRLSVRQLNADFRQYFHQSPSSYIAGRRLVRARELLYFSDYTITEIAEQTGFHSVHYFSSFFKKRMGVSPHSYRLNLQNALEKIRS